MKGLYSQFKTDPEMEKSGVWVEYGENSKGEPIRFLIARAGGANEQYMKVLEAKAKPFRRQIQTEVIERKTLEKITRETFALTCLKGWENVEDANGNPMAYTAENVVKLLADLPELSTDLQEQATRVALYREMIQQEDLGN